ncbi:MAG: 2TM domain-containing protein [Algicola sp.]|nr:2TM domain-containing protein [Algicola sp.]
MTPNFSEQERLNRARKRVKQLKGFYMHALVYLVVNTFILVVNNNYTSSGESFFQWENFSTAIFWGVGLLIHALTVYAPNFIMGKNWEARKIKQFMEQDAKNNQ